MSLEQNSCAETEKLLDTYNSSYDSQCEPSYENTDEDYSSPKKKRKIDKDGFLCPATPDIPITSCQYGQPKPQYLECKDQDTVLEYDEQSYEEEIQLPAENDDTPSGNDSVHTDPIPSGNHPSHTDQSQPEQQFNEESTTSKDRSGQSMAEIIQDLGQDSKMLHNQWAEMFRESENFENFCPVRLDKMIEQAKQLEESLLKQKELLCTRLNVISHIIKTSITEGPGGDN